MLPRLRALQPEQPRVVDALVTAMSNDRAHHAYLLVGADPGQSDKLAWAITHCIICTAPRSSDDPCETCASCRQLAAGTHPDVVVVKPNEKGVILVDVIRQLTRRLALAATLSSSKVALILDADRMNPQAQNALLKTLEEPPGRAYFLLSTHRRRALLPTVRSRCQQLALKPAARMSAWRTLAQEGIEDPLAQLLSALVGGNTTQAREHLDNGAREVLDKLEAVMGSPPEPTSLLAAAADLGSDSVRYDLTLGFLEVLLRDRLAQLRGASEHQLCAPQVRIADGFGVAAVNEAAVRLVQARRLSSHNLNRAMTLEGVLAALFGEPGPKVATTRVQGRMAP